MKGLRVALVVLLLTSAALADRWTFFHPEAVTEVSCKVTLVDSTAHADTVHQDVWEATAHATRNDPALGNWAMTIATYPASVKGRHSAEKACSVWMDEATKRLKQAKL